MTMCLRWKCFLFFVAVMVSACGPASTESSDAAGSVDAQVNDGPGQLRGTIWAPGNAPGDVTPGYEVPIPGALVYLTISTPPTIPQHAHCEQCVGTPGSSAIADPKGNFVLTGILPGDYLLVVQKGQFRLETPIEVTAGTQELSPQMTTLPNTHDPDNGKWLPRMALATGSYDHLEDIFGKLGIGGSVDADGNFVPDNEAGTPGSQLHFYSNRPSNNFNSSGTLTDLVSDLELMKQYHIIFIPCASSANTDALRNQHNLRNIRDYVAAGGKLYVADWSGEWADNVFPAQIQLRGADNDTPASAYNSDNDTWNIALFGNADGNNYSSRNAEVVDEVAHAWLDGQLSPQVSGDDVPTNADDFHISDIWNVVESLNAVLVGVDDEGLPVYDEPKAIVIGGVHPVNGGLPKRPLTVSYQPGGCGRVIFTAYHTAHGINNTHDGLLPQERLLIYLIMEIGECVDNVVID